MPVKNSDIMAQLQRDILPLQGFKLPANGNAVNFGLGAIEAAFPNAAFPLGAIHEFVSASQEDAAATGGFIACLLAALMRSGGVAVWVSSSRTVFPPALHVFGISPERIIFVDLQKEKDILWVMEEALKSEGLAAVVAELKEISFTASRRLQLAVEQSRVTGFILRNHPHQVNTIASVSRWKITSLPSMSEEGMPGLGFPRWNIELLKIRNGMPGSWQMEWVGEQFRPLLPDMVSVLQEQKRRAG